MPSRAPVDRPGPREFRIVDPPPASRPDLSPRQRWRLYLHVPAAHGRGDTPTGAGGWTALIERTDLPLAASTGARARVGVAAQLPMGVTGEREIVDVALVARRSLAEVREAVSRVLPDGVRLVDLHDVWVGAPAAAAAVTAADYRLQIAGASATELGTAARALIEADRLPRVRRREKKSTDYDLRPLLLAVRVRPPGPAAPARCSAVLELRLRHSSDAVGRPDEVLAALGEPPAPPLAAALDLVSAVRTRLVLEGDED